MEVNQLFDWYTTSMGFVAANDTSTNIHVLFEDVGKKTYTDGFIIMFRPKLCNF